MCVFEVVFQDVVWGIDIGVRMRVGRLGGLWRGDSGFDQGGSGD